MIDRLAEIEQEFHRTRDGVRHCLGHEYNEWLIDEVKRRGQMLDRITIERGQAIQTARQIKAEVEGLRVAIQQAADALARHNGVGFSLAECDADAWDAREILLAALNQPAVLPTTATTEVCP